jgi:gluconate 2-dehydrogenase gamma chain
VIRIRLPRTGRPPAGLLPPGLRWDAPRDTVAALLTRREFLKAVVVLLGLAAAPLVRVERAAARARGRFFTARERATLEALVDVVIPPEPGVPGAVALGAADYVENLLTALDGRRARLFAGGPFSGRTPFPDERRGRPSRRRPRNAFRRFVPPTRLQAAHWRAELFGSAAVPAVAALDAQYGGPKQGLRDLYRESLARVDAVAEATARRRFASLSPADRAAVFAMLDDGAFRPDPRRGGATFVDLLVQHTIEGCFSVPEYGGNTRGRGWAMIGLEGDSQPLGYSIFSTAAGGYVERPDHPMSTPNPDEIGPDGRLAPKPLTADGQAIQQGIVTTTSIFADGSIC